MSHPRGELQLRSACQIRSSYGRHDVLPAGTQINHNREAGFSRARNGRRGEVVFVIHIAAVSGLLVSSFTAANAQLVKGTRSQRAGVLLVLEGLASGGSLRRAPSSRAQGLLLSHKGCSCPAPPAFQKGRAGTGDLPKVLR